MIGPAHTPLSPVIDPCAAGATASATLSNPVRQTGQLVWGTIMAEPPPAPRTERHSSRGAYRREDEHVTRTLGVLGTVCLGIMLAARALPSAFPLLLFLGVAVVGPLMLLVALAWRLVLRHPVADMLLGAWLWRRHERQTPRRATGNPWAPLDPRAWRP